MAQPVIAARPGWPNAERAMRIVSEDRLVPLAGLLFVVGAVAGFGAVSGLKGCAMGSPGEPGPASPGPVTEGGMTGADRAQARKGGASGVSPDPDRNDGAGEGAGGPGAERTVEGPEEGAPPAAPLPDGLPEGRALAELEAPACLEWLDALDLPVDRRAKPLREAAEVVETPLFLRGPVRGVAFEHIGRSEVHEVIDCRLVLALVRWTTDLREAGVRKVEHMSIYRPEAEVRGTGERSGHAVALAIDAAKFELEDGRVLDVEADWSDKRRGADPCTERDDEPESQALLRKLVCDALDRDVFQVAITPHHNRAHRNHVHLEIVPGVDWSYVR